jgi:hypothetical protein
MMLFQQLEKTAAQYGVTNIKKRCIGVPDE